ncbi:putative plant self-incompatibility S1 [Arabidopsis thaliana]
MTFNNKSYFIILFMIFSTLIFFVSALDFPNAPAEAPSSDHDGFLPLAKKHVVICNKVKNREILNVHCRSSEDDFGWVHIPWNGTWDFSFHVNFWKNTKFRLSKDDNPTGHFPVCKECIWEVGKYGDNGHICRIVREGGYLPFCFKWEDGP